MGLQKKLKYKLYGEFADYETAELTEWFRDAINGTDPNCKSLKITIDWEPNVDAA